MAPCVYIERVRCNLPRRAPVQLLKNYSLLGIYIHYFIYTYFTSTSKLRHNLSECCKYKFNIYFLYQLYQFCCFHYLSSRSLNHIRILAKPVIIVFLIYRGLLIGVRVGIQTIHEQNSLNVVWNVNIFENNSLLARENNNLRRRPLNLV